MTEKIIISVSNLVKNYGHFEAVKGISFDVREGEIFGLLGPNGAGKSTTLEIIETLREKTSGRVMVDGQVVRRFGARVDPEHHIIRVDGKRVPARQDVVYLAFNKPRGVLTAMSDERGRKTIVDFLGMRAERLFHVGRLDYDTEGLMLLTNDGELAHRLAHPSYEVAKTYCAEVPGPVPRDLGRRLQAGVELEDGVAVADKFRVLDQSGGRAMVEITLHEGRKHIVRRMLAEAGHPVSRLLRTTVGPIRLGGLRPGATRDLSTKEIGELYAAVGM